MSKKEKRMTLLQNLGILTLTLISLYYINLLFGSQISSLINAATAIILPLAIALFISYLLAPIVKLIDKKIQIRWLSIVIVFFFLLVILALFIAFVGNMIYDQAVIFIYKDWSTIIVYIQDFADRSDALKDFYDSISEYIAFDEVSPIIINVFNLFKSLTAIVLTIVLTPVFLFFILQDKQKIFEGFLVVLPKKYQKDVKELGKRSNEVIEKYFNGRFISMLIMSVFFTIIFFIFGLGERSIFFGFTLGFLDIIPYIGGFIGLAIPVLYSFTVPDELLFHEYTFIALIIANFIGQGLQGSIIQPWIMGREVNLHPLLVLSSFIFFGALFGVIGIILAIPITGIIKVSFEYFAELKAEELKSKQ